MTSVAAYLDVKDADGTIAHWSFELGGVNGLYRQGWRKEDLQPGTALTVEGFLSRTDLHVGNSQNITLSDRRRLFSGSRAPRSIRGLRRTVTVLKRRRPTRHL